MTRIETEMRRYEAQSTLFEFAPRRIKLQKLDLQADTASKSSMVNVWRNHAFEPLVPLVNTYAAFRDWRLSFRLSGYDDSFSFDGVESASIELVWMDSSRILSNIEFPEWLEWLRNRLSTLRQLSSAPIILATWLHEEKQCQALEQMLNTLPDTHFANLGRICDEAGVRLVEDRSAIMAGTPLSNRSQVIISRILACKWLPAATLPPIKAIALDLDNTLHDGVLGEDGIDGVELTHEHEALQIFIKDLQKRGVFIALVSRNEMEDVEDLFAKRKDYPLRWEDFSAVEVSWGNKADSLRRISERLRISTDAILFVDDNPGELAAVTQQLMTIKTIHAAPCATLTRSSIEFYPGLWRWKQEDDDAKRILDLKASSKRDRLASACTNPAEYMRSLQVTLTHFVDERSQLGRLSDLCGKTNQFNLAMRRFNESELSDKMSRDNACVASVRLSDRLSDSGIVALIVVERVGATLVVEELCISCRAMGRGLENDMVLEAFRQMPIIDGCDEIEFCASHGERNQPAREWLKNLVETVGARDIDAKNPRIVIDTLNAISSTEGILFARGE